MTNGASKPRVTGKLTFWAVPHRPIRSCALAALGYLAFHALSSPKYAAYAYQPSLSADLSNVSGKWGSMMIIGRDSGTNSVNGIHRMS